LNILFLSVEVAPFAKVGGLADVAGSLPKALRALGHDVRILMPSYKMVEDDKRWEITDVIPSFQIHESETVSRSAYLRQTHLDSVPVYLLGTDAWFNQALDSATVYRPGIEQYLFYSTGALQACRELGWMPDVVHCNDWHTGFVPVLMREREKEVWDGVASVMTIHNLAYQGEFGLDILEFLNLPTELFNLHQVEAHGRVNFLKAGCVYADMVNTVSPNYAREVQTASFGATLDGLMRFLASENRFSGILNGIDEQVFDPETDPALPAHFSATDRTGKAKCRAALYERLALAPIPDAPILGVVSRLSAQKGIDILVEAGPALFALPVQLVVQGIGDPAIAEALRTTAAENPANLKFVEEFAPDTAQLVYGGCDGFLMPSRFEPCGLGQMIAMRYGALPIVRKTGGLADTVFEGMNGFVFEDGPSGLIAACKRAVDAYRQPQTWDKMAVAAMTADYSWRKSAQAYLELYHGAIAHRAQNRKSA